MVAGMTSESATDYVFKSDQDLGYAMAIVGGGVALVATLILFAGIGPYKKSIERAKAWAGA